MPDQWQLLRTGAGAAAWNMAVDEALLIHAERPVLRLYSWAEAAATFGYFQPFEEACAATALRPLIRRCTGGGVVPHDADWTYSLVIPRGHAWYRLPAVESYRRLHQWVADSIGEGARLAECCDSEGTGRCFVGFERHDVLWQGRKIAGAAQRRNRSGLLIQGSIRPPEGMERAEWEERLLKCAPAGVRWASHELDPAMQDEAERLVATKYGNPEYNRRR